MIFKEVETMHYRNTFLPSYFSMTCLSLTLSKKLENLPKKNVSILAEGYPRKHEMQFASKKGVLEKQQSVPNT